MMINDMLNDLRFTTFSGTEYALKDIIRHVVVTGEECPGVGPKGVPVAVHYTALMARMGTPLRHVDGGFIETSYEFHTIRFNHLPQLDERFNYYHPVWQWGYSTPVQCVEEQRRKV